MKTRMSYDQAKVIADRIVEEITPYCVRVEIAGSIRRQKETIGDVEIVAIPNYVVSRNLFGEVSQRVSLLDIAIESREVLPYPMVRGGEFMKCFTMRDCQLDLFLTTPEKWGVIFMIRTGSAEFTHWIMTPKRYGGGMPAYLKISGGRVWQGDKVLETPEEADVFEALGMDWIEPKDRNR